MAVIGSAHLQLFVAFLCAVSAAKIDSNTRTLLRSGRSVTDSDEITDSCSQTTILQLCENQILHATGIIQRFDQPTQILITEYYAKSTPDCKIMVCFATLQAIAYESERHCSDTYQINGTELLQTLNENCTSTATSLTETSGKTITNTATTNTTVIIADEYESHDSYKQTTIAAGQSNSILTTILPKLNSSYGASYELGILPNGKKPTETEKPIQVESAGNKSSIVSSPASNGNSVTISETAIVNKVPQKIQHDELNNTSGSSSSKEKQAKVIDVSTTYASGENKKLLANNANEPKPPKKGTMYYIAGGDNSHLIKEAQSTTEATSMGSFEIGKVSEKRNFTQIDETAEIIHDEPTITTSTVVQNEIQNMTKPGGYLNYEAGADNSHLYQSPKISTTIAMQNSKRPATNASNLQQTSQQMQQIEVEKQLDIILNDQVSSNNTNSTSLPVEQLCEKKDPNLALLSKIVSALKLNSSTGHISKKSSLSFAASGEIAFKNEGETGFNNEFGVEWHNMIGVFPNKTMRILVHSDLKTESEFVEYFSKYGTLFPVPDCNATATNITDIQNIFPRIAIPTTFSAHASVSVFSPFKEAIKHLSESARKIVSVQDIKPIRNINLLQHNLADLIATGEHSMSKEVFEFFITYLEALKFADSVLCNAEAGVNNVTNQTWTEIQQGTGTEEASDLFLHHTIVELTKTVNLTDYLASTLNRENVPEILWDELAQLYEFLLVDVNYHVLDNFFPTSNQKNIFVRDLFEYLLNSTADITEDEKNRLRKFLMYI